MRREKREGKREGRGEGERDTALSTHTVPSSVVEADSSLLSLALSLTGAIVAFISLCQQPAISCSMWMCATTVCKAGKGVPFWVKRPLEVNLEMQFNSDPMGGTLKGFRL